jgi:hypothetical protein
MHRTPSSLKGRLDTNNLRTSETKIMSQSMINFGTMHIKLYEHSKGTCLHIRNIIRV